jgi:hypothetical protein
VRLNSYNGQVGDLINVTEVDPSAVPIQVTGLLTAAPAAARSRCTGRWSRPPWGTTRVWQTPTDALRRHGTWSSAVTE